jgi:hypothetical protein
MDDTLWIAQSKTQLEEITNIASSFYSMADIQVNSNKSVSLQNKAPPTFHFLTLVFNLFLPTNYLNF